jgi:hypothetical protein
MATPHVAGAVALIKSHNPEWSGSKVRTHLLKTVDASDAYTYAVSSGGRLNVYNALEYDTIPPGTVGRVWVFEEGITNFKIKFLPVGDDGDVGKASRYEVRISKKAIESVEDWELAEKVLFDFKSGEDFITANIKNLPFNSYGHVAVRAIDNVGNYGHFSPSVSYRLKEIRVLNEYTGSLDGFYTDAPWGTEGYGEHEIAYSDSPGEKYANGVDASLRLPALKVHSYMAVSFDMSVDLEYAFDNGYFEISQDGNSWKTVEKYSGKIDWKNYTIELDLDGYGEYFYLRYRLNTDTSVSYGGLLIDNIKIIGLK